MAISPRTFLSFVTLVLIFACSSTEAFAAKGVVTSKMSGCDYFVVSTSKGFDLLEWYGGYDPDKGDVLIGEFESYGMHEIYDATTEEGLNVWVEDYSLSKAGALENLVDQCE